MKTSIPTRYALLVFASSLLLNFGAFLWNYRRLAFPHLTEEQRVANADEVLTLTLASFVLTALLLGALTFWLVSRAAGRHSA